MDILNDKNSEIYNKSIKRNQEYIEKKLKITKLKSLRNNVQIIGSFQDILDHIKYGPATNLIQNFFKFSLNKMKERLY